MSSQLSPLLRRGLLTAAAALATALPATAQAPPGAPMPPAAGGGAPRPAPNPAEPKPFEEVIKDAEKISGHWDLYRTKANSLWLEVKPEMLDRPYFLEVTTTTGLGGREGGVATGDPLFDAVFTLKRVREQVFVNVKQTNFRTKEGEPISKSLARSFGDSLLAAFAVGSQPHPDRKSVLVNVTDFFYTDHGMLAQALTRRMGAPVTLDRAKSYLDTVKSLPENVEIETSCNFASPRAQAPDTVADGRSGVVRVHFSFLPLTDSSYQPRLYDNRVGYFVTAFRDLTDDDPKQTFTRYIQRFRLEKKDPSADLSEAKKPIVFYLDDAIPMRYRKAVADGFLIWNRAFERIGFKDAVQVKQLEKGDEIDPFDVRYNVLRWATSNDDGYAVALARANPITGEVMNAAIRVDASIVGLTRRSFRWEDELKGFKGEAQPPDPNKLFRCEYGQMAVQDAAFGMTALDLLAADPDGLSASERDRFTREYITEVVAHEFGHILGLRHNFKASTLIAVKDLNNTELTSKLGLSGSVMDYNPANIAPPGTKQGEYFATTVGPYDLWAIEYGYSEWPGLTTPEAEKPKLDLIAQRSGDPALAYATDEDVVDMGFGAWSTDPLASRFDMSADPLAFAQRRAKMVRALYAKLEEKSPRWGESYEDTRLKFRQLLGTYLSSFRPAGKYIGGLYYSRAHKGDLRAPNAPFQVVPAAKQREALAFITTGLFDPGAFQFKPSLLNKLGMDKNWHWGIEPFGEALAYSVPDRVATQQKAILSWLFTPGLLARLRDNETRVADPKQTLTMAELFDAMSGAIFAELKDAKVTRVPTLRRDLQREYVSVLAGLTLGGGSAPQDAQALARMHMKQASFRMMAALRRPGLDTTTRAHLEQEIARIQRALKAQAISL
jgi:hypothetical protein